MPSGFGFWILLPFIKSRLLFKNSPHRKVLFSFKFSKNRKFFNSSVSFTSLNLFINNFSLKTSSSSSFFCAANSRYKLLRDRHSK